MRRQILIVEDNELNREILCQILTEQYSVLQAENGQVAMEILHQYKDSIALILLDVMMPVMDGYTFLDKVKADVELSRVPVIVMTQSNSKEDEVAALSHGATDFVPKPYRPQVILHRVASLIKLCETASMVNQFQYDRLTGLYSKEFFYQKVRDRLEANPEQSFFIICSNIENFKLYNDSYGREAGDRLLKECAASLRSIVGEEAICGRYGADRFLCLQEKEREKTDRDTFFNFDASNCSEGMKNISFKFGVYEITDRSAPIEQMCDRALLAADSIRGQYNQYFAVYDDALRGKMLREKAITDAMETALAESQFVVYLQPKYSLSDSCLAGAEALVRWIHPEWGFMSPGEFIPLFEKNGFIHRLDLFVWEKVCALLRSWQDKGYPLLPISVNVSRADVFHVRMVETLSELIKKYDIDPAYVHLEITESAYAENPGQIISTVAQLRKLGFPVEMDDFGSGYSSLNMLSQMKLDILKLDKKFVQNEIAKPAEQSILNDIVAMAHRMHLRVVAEGVESREQVKRLREVNCDYVQGYYFSKPLTVSEFEELWKSQLDCPVSSLRIALRKEPKLFRLLVVDDDTEYQKKVRDIFPETYDILEVSDEERALAIIQNDSDISAVLLSLALPGDGGAMILRTMRQNPLYWQIPVLATIPCGDIMGQFPLVTEADDFLCKCHPLFDLRSRVERLLEIVATRKRENALREAVNHDFLTGLLNRRGLQVEVDTLRKEDFPLAICIFDIDDLKKVNDTGGHDAGDRALMAFAKALCGCTRQEDILCRYGGDEFLVILRHLNDAAAAEKKCTDIIRAFHDAFSETPDRVSCSAGIVLSGMDEKSCEELIKRADQALYCAKRKNKISSVWNSDYQ